MKRFREVSAILAISLFAGLPISATAAPIEKCKPLNVNGQNVDLGLPRNTLQLPSVGTVKILVVGVDFSNARDAGNALEMAAGFQLETVKEFFETSSYGKLNLDFTIAREILKLPVSDSGITESTISSEVGKTLPSTYRLSDYKGLLVITSKYSSYSSSSASPGATVENSTGKLTNYAVLAGIKPNENRWLSSPWRTAAHEIGHLMGLMDLWDREDSLAWQGQTAAPFSLMNTGAGWGYAADFFAWEKWVLGWIPDQDVVCLDKNLTEVTSALVGLDNNSGIRLIVLPISLSKVIALEYRRKSPIDYGISKSGVLVYSVDTSKKNFEVPITLIPSLDSLKVPFSQSVRDFERFKDAPISQYDFVGSEGFQFANLGVETNQGVLVTSKTSNEIKTYLKNLEFQDAQSKAAEAAKLKLEAEAKVATTKVVALKKITITCIKGKLIRKVTAIKPICPMGYKKK